MNLPDRLTNAFLCGDCFEELAKLPDESVDLVLTDPPYGIDYQSNRRVVRPKLPKFENDVDLSWLAEWVEQIHRVLKMDRHFYCFCRFDTYPEFFRAISQRFKVKNGLIWVKNNHGSGDLDGSYAPQCEMIIFAVKGKRLLNGQRDSDVLPYGTVSSAARGHPTQKPIGLLRFLIEKSTEPDEIVLDPFAGTGSTGLACIDTRDAGGDRHPRRYLLIEINSEYVRKGIHGGGGSQQRLLDVAAKAREEKPKARTTVRSSRLRIRARKDETMPIPF